MQLEQLPKVLKLNLVMTKTQVLVNKLVRLLKVLKLNRVMSNKAKVQLELVHLKTLNQVKMVLVLQ